jgi:hypothetical protein
MDTLGRAVVVLEDFLKTEHGKRAWSKGQRAGGERVQGVGGRE